MLLIKNLQLEREINYKEHKKYIYFKFTLFRFAKFTNDMDFWIFFPLL